MTYQELSRRVAALKSTSTFQTMTWITRSTLIKAVADADDFDELPDWVQQTIPAAEAE